MSGGKLRWMLLAAGCVAGGLLLIAIVLGIQAAGDPRQKRILPGGSTLVLEPTIFTATNFQYSYQSGNPFLRRIAFLLPPGVRKRISWSSGSFGYGGGGETNLLVVSITKHSSKTGPRLLPSRIRIVDEAGEEFDTCWGANTLGMGDATVHGWQVRAFPRRTASLHLQFLAMAAPSGGWTNIAEFTIKNPAYGKYPQWTPEPIPGTRSTGSLAVTLAEFKSGARLRDPQGLAPRSTVARKTQLQFTFAEEGKAVTNWMVQKLTISDATGNQWFPYLDFVRHDFSWAEGGKVEFFGALWPGEAAWKLKVELVRTGGLPPDELWEVPLDLPTARTVTSLTNRWFHDDRTLKLIALASPTTDHTGDFKWTAKWWGEDKTRVYSLALQVEGAFKGCRATVVQAMDQNGAPIKIMEHRQDSPDQAVFFRPNDDATQARLTFALQRSRFVEFLARPEFVREPGTNRAAEARP
jgi:hypothetical protein